MITKHPKRAGDQCVTVSLSELIALSSTAKDISLAALRPKSVLSGQRQSRLLARGMDFAESRRYQSGDDIRNIDWRVTARTGKPHTKLFTEEKERQVILSIDMRSPMFFATKGVFKSVQAALMSSYIAWNTAQKGDRLGGIVFNDHQMAEYRPALRNKGVLPLLHGLAIQADYFSRRKSSPVPSKNAILEEVIASIRIMATPGSFVFFISDFRDLTPLGHDLLLQISRHCNLCLCFVYDEIEASLPKNGYYPVINGNNELQLNTYDKTSLERYQQQFNARKSMVASLREHRNVHFIECSTQDDCLDLLRR